MLYAFRSIAIFRRGTDEQLIDYFERNSNDKLLVAEIGPPAWYNLQHEEYAKTRLNCESSRPPKPLSESLADSSPDE